jgi:hypothetical protein
MVAPGTRTAEVVLDNTRTAYARWNNGSTWSQWWLLGSGIADVSVAAANVSSADTACVSVVFRGGDRGFHALTSSGVEGINL